MKEKFEKNTKLIQFNGSHGTKTFQILGTVTPEYFGSQGKTYLDENVEGSNYRKFRDKAYQDFMTEFKKNIDQKPGGHVEYNLNGGTRNFGFYKYSDFTSEVEYIYTGRLIKETDSKKADEQRNLGDILTEEQRNDPEGHLQIRILFDNFGDQKLDFGANLGGEVVPLNTNFFENAVTQEAGHVRSGTVWILTREADGNVYYKGCRLNSFTKQWYEANKDNHDNYYIRNIRGTLSKIVKNHADLDDILKNLENLQNLIYLDENHKVFVDGRRGALFVGNDRKVGVSLTEGSTEEIVDNILEYMFDHNPGGYRFSLSNSGMKLKSIIDSNIITTDLAQLNNAGASFAISKLSMRENGEFESVPSETFKVVRTQYRHTGTIG